MKITDPIADMFTRIRNALNVKHDDVMIPYSKMKLEIAKILQEEGFVKKHEIIDSEASKRNIKINLKYDNKLNPLIRKIERKSLPGKRIYVRKSEVPKVLNGFGISIVSTSKGVMTGRNARLNNMGGELIGIIH
jgi:small subunit ribosomal protein S8